MEKLKPRTLSGFMELPPRQQMKMERMLSILRESYSLYGFTPLDTPVIESAEVLLAKGGGSIKPDRVRGLTFAICAFLSVGKSPENAVGALHEAPADSAQVKTGAA